MPNIFDGLKSKAFDIVARTVGYDCFWQELSAKVLLRQPTETERLTGNINYDPRMVVMEYRAGQLPGLFEAVRDNEEVSLTIEGATYYPRHAGAIFDGDTYTIHLVKQ